MDFVKREQHNIVDDDIYKAFAEAVQKSQHMDMSQEFQHAAITVEQLHQAMQNTLAHNLQIPLSPRQVSSLLGRGLQLNDLQCQLARQAGMEGDAAQQSLADEAALVLGQPNGLHGLLQQELHQDPRGGLHVPQSTDRNLSHLTHDLSHGLDHELDLSHHLSRSQGVDMNQLSMSQEDPRRMSMAHSGQGLVDPRLGLPGLATPSVDPRLGLPGLATPGLERPPNGQELMPPIPFQIKAEQDEDQHYYDVEAEHNFGNAIPVHIQGDEQTSLQPQPMYSYYTHYSATAASTVDVYARQQGYVMPGYTDPNAGHDNDPQNLVVNRQFDHTLAYAPEELKRQKLIDQPNDKDVDDLKVDAKTTDDQKIIYEQYHDSLEQVHRQFENRLGYLSDGLKRHKTLNDDAKTLKPAELVDTLKSEDNEKIFYDQYNENVEQVHRQFESRLGYLSEEFKRQKILNELPKNVKPVDDSKENKLNEGQKTFYSQYPLNDDRHYDGKNENDSSVHNKLPISSADDAAYKNLIEAEYANIKGEYTCYKCNEIFSSKRSLKQHTKKCGDLTIDELGEEKSGKFGCTQCPYKCQSPAVLKIHERTHTGEKPFSCKFCDYKSGQKNNVAKHILVHMKEKPFRCQYCDYRCAQKNNLVVHERTHTGYKPFACTYCEYRTVQKPNLVKHMYLHTDQKPFSCDLCTYRCVQKTNLTKHKQRHINEGNGQREVTVKPYRPRQKTIKCELCSYKCVQRSSLEKHVDFKHSDIKMADNACVKMADSACVKMAECARGVEGVCDSVRGGEGACDRARGVEGGCDSVQNLSVRREEELLSAPALA